QLPGQLEGALVAVDVDHHPAGDEVLGLSERAIGDRRTPLTVIPDPRPLRGQRLTVDELARPLQPGREVAHVLHVHRDLLRRPPVHRHVVNRSRSATVMLEQQVLRHRDTPRSWSDPFWSRPPRGRSRSRVLDIAVAKFLALVAEPG